MYDLLVIAILSTWKITLRVALCLKFARFIEEIDHQDFFTA